MNQGKYIFPHLTDFLPRRVFDRIVSNHLQLMIDTRKHILFESYKLFLSYNIEKVTITELERATSKIRGIIFYHFSNKQQLFEAVVDEVFTLIRYCTRDDRCCIPRFFR